MYQTMRNLAFPLLAASAILFSSCASSQGGGDRAAMCKERYASAEKEFKAGNYGKVKEPLEEILSTCAGTGYMEQTEFLLAESYFHLEEWLEARGEYGSFVLNFPSSPYIETAEYRKAVSSFNMEYTIGRDDSNTDLAMKDFERFISNYPNSPLIDSVEYYRAKLMERKAEQDFRTARLYYRMDHPRSTIIYLKEFLDVYPKSARLPEALYLLAQSYTALDQFDTARAYLQRAQTMIPPDYKDKDKDIQSLSKDIDEAEVKYQKKLAKELAKKLQRKEETAEGK